jgi:hypothetical protein
VAAPIVLDTNILLECGRGNKPVAKALVRYLLKGDKVYIAQAAYDELVTRNSLGAQYKQLLDDLGIAVAPEGNMEPRVEMYSRNITVKPPTKGKPGGPIDGTRTQDDATKPGDIFVVAQARAINGRLWTLDEKIVNRAPQFGATLVPECTLAKKPSPTNDPAVARQLLFGYKALAALDDYRMRLEKQLDLYSGEHRMLSDQATNSFVGYWVNHAFNTDPPPLMIWDNASLRLDAAGRALKKEDVAEASKQLLMARSFYLAALKRYMTWKEGIDPAGTRAQVAIGITAATAILAAVGAYAAAPAAAAGSAADATAAATQTVTRIACVVEKADAVIRIADAASLETEILAESELELAMEELAHLPPF